MKNGGNSTSLVIAECDICNLGTKKWRSERWLAYSKVSPFELEYILNSPNSAKFSVFSCYFFKTSPLVSYHYSWVLQPSNIIVLYVSIRALITIVQNFPFSGLRFRFTIVGLPFSVSRFVGFEILLPNELFPSMILKPLVRFYPEKLSIMRKNHLAKIADGIVSTTFTQFFS